MIRQLYHISQDTTVADYVQRFSELVDQLIAYEHTTDPMYYTIRFVDGLRSDIRASVLVQRPSTLDSACSLALLQEEISRCVRVFHQQDTPLVACFSAKGPHSLPALPIANKQDVHILPEEKKIC